jgi:hypothetical protein
MDVFQARALVAVSESFRRLRDGEFAEPLLAVDEIKRLAEVCEPVHARCVAAWLQARSVREVARATRAQARQARQQAERNRVRFNLTLIDFGEPRATG